MKSRDYDVDELMQQMEQIKVKYNVVQWSDLYDIPQARRELIDLLRPLMPMAKQTEQ